MIQATLIDDGHAEKLERDREHEVDRTPGAVVHQGISWGLDVWCQRRPPPPSRIVDVCAGAGVFGQQARIILGPDPVILAIEMRAEEFPAVERHYDCAINTTVEAWARDDSLTGSTGFDADLVMGNPAFSIFPFIVREYLKHARMVLLYGGVTWGCAEGNDEPGAEDGAALFREFPPFACARVVGRVGHRGPGTNPKTGKPWGADLRDNCWWLWLSGNTNPRWTCENLPPLATAQRRWLVPPGSEE